MTKLHSELGFIQVFKDVKRRVSTGPLTTSKSRFLRENNVAFFMQYQMFRNDSGEGNCRPQNKVISD